jgi:hypothetical protein
MNPAGFPAFLPNLLPNLAESDGHTNPRRNHGTDP